MTQNPDSVDPYLGASLHLHSIRAAKRLVFHFAVPIGDTEQFCQVSNGKRREESVTSGIDFIGDIHGSGEKLEGLLAALGYEIRHNVHRHADRQALFVGDLIDRGPNQLRVLEIVKAMADVGAAKVVMGNHEFNAIAYALPKGGSGEFCRPHNDKNRRQHHAFLEQLSRHEREHWLQRIATLPLWLDFGDVRAIHACWDDDSISFLERELGGSSFTRNDQIEAASNKGSDSYRAVERILKGPELTLADYGLPPFTHNGDHQRDEARIRGWVGGSKFVCDLAEIARDAQREGGKPYPKITSRRQLLPEDAVPPPSLIPVIYFHYWRTWGTMGEAFHQWSPTQNVDWTPRSACVDFSAVKGGPLVAYRWNDGDVEINPSCFVAYR